MTRVVYMDVHGTTKTPLKTTGMAGHNCCTAIIIASDKRHMPLPSKMYLQPHGRMYGQVFVGFGDEESVMPYNPSDTTCFRWPSAALVWRLPARECIPSGKVCNSIASNLFFKQKARVVLSCQR